MAGSGNTKQARAALAAASSEPRSDDVACNMDPGSAGSSEVAVDMRDVDYVGTAFGAVIMDLPVVE